MTDTTDKSGVRRINGSYDLIDAPARWHSLQEVDIPLLGYIHSNQRFLIHSMGIIVRFRCSDVDFVYFTCLRGNNCQQY